MKKLSGMLIIGAVAGLVAGYFLFAEVAGVRFSVTDLLPVSGGGIGAGFGRLAQRVAGIEEIRRNILLSGAAGAVVAGGASVLFRRK